MSEFSSFFYFELWESYYSNFERLFYWIYFCITFFSGIQTWFVLKGNENSKVSIKRLTDFKTTNYLKLNIVVDHRRWILKRRCFWRNLKSANAGRSELWSDYLRARTRSRCARITWSGKGFERTFVWTMVWNLPDQRSLRPGMVWSEVDLSAH